ncbi:MAG TPA: hypothetical protein VLI41_10805 [Phenylobacterium sp.]|uniref:hypothetical protein n=1 Tax=Phenylobacterium sp. TaxID=1871053 RepID=UPI002B680806|nr:hypothetical protein [Phenylobacterium sp.]HSV03679.1 hypothetical protein [Phenylobacterium sp.]
MRRALALAGLIALTAATTASAETWKKYANGENGTEWSYNSDYSYRDKATGRVVVMKAISKPSANIAPGGPGAGVGFVEAIDCAKGSTLLMGSYKPSAELAINPQWRESTPKKAEPELMAAVCPSAGKLAVK